MNDPPLNFKNDACTKNYLTATFLWTLKCSTKITDDDIEKYLILFDVVDLQNMKCFQYFASSIPSRRKDGFGEKTRLDFIPVSKDAPDLHNYFTRCLKI